MTVINPMDLERIFVVILAGSPEIFTALLFIIISALSAYFKMDNKVVMVMYLISGIIMSVYIGAIYVLIILIVGIITFYSVSRMFNR